MAGKTLYDKIWDAHVVDVTDGEAILYIDLHLIHEVTSPQAFDGLRLPRLAAGHFADNPASGAVLRKLGFAATGETCGTQSLARGGIVPTVRYALGRDDWACRMPLCLAA